MPGFSLTRLDASLTHQNRPGRTVSQSGASPGRVQITPVRSCKLCNQWHWVQIYWLKKPLICPAGEWTLCRSHLGEVTCRALWHLNLLTHQYLHNSWSILKGFYYKSIHRIRYTEIFFWKVLFWKCTIWSMKSSFIYGMTRPDVQTSYPPVFDSKIY